MSNRWIIPIIQGAASAIPFGLLGGFGSGDSILPWLGMFAGSAAWVLVVRWGISRGWWLVEHEEGAPISAYLSILGVTAASSRADVQRAFRERAKRHHPDAGGDAAEFRELVEAREHVLDELANG